MTDSIPKNDPVLRSRFISPSENPSAMCALPRFVEDIMASCLGCRRCEKVCPSYRLGGCSPWLSMLERDNANTLMCIGCGKCSTVCKHTDPRLALMYLKAEMMKAQVPESFHQTGFALPPASDEWKNKVPAYEEKNDVYLIPGCKVQSMVPYLKYAAWKVFDSLGVGLAELPANTCCMYPVPFRVMEEPIRNGYKYVMRANAGGKDMVTLCSGCTNELGMSGVYAPHVSVYLTKYLDKIRSFPGVKLKVALEPGCSGERFLKDIRMIVEATGAEIVNRSYGCCGKNVEGINTKLMAEREKECEGADVIVVCCPNCMTFYDKYEGGLPVIHIIELLALATGDTNTLQFHNIRLSDKIISEKVNSRS